jgi:sugar/nucleoside kinase (ribokinase family)
VWAGRAAVVAPCGDEFPRARFPALDFTQSRRLPHTMRNWGLYEDDGSRHFLSRRDSLPWDAFSSDVADLGRGPYPHAHLAPMPWARVGALVDALRERGARTVSLDLHDRVIAEAPREALLALLARVDVFLPSRQDTDVLFPGALPLGALAQLRALLPAVPVLGVKSGEDGAFVHAAGSPDVLIVPPAATAVVDATGAGDAFCGGFLAGYARTGDATEAALCGAAAASFALASVGLDALAGAGATEAAARVAAVRARITTAPLGAP